MMSDEPGHELDVKEFESTLDTFINAEPESGLQEHQQATVTEAPPNAVRKDTETGLKGILSKATTFGRAADINGTSKSKPEEEPQKQFGINLGSILDQTVGSMGQNIDWVRKKVLDPLTRAFDNNDVQTSCPLLLVCCCRIEKEILNFVYDTLERQASAVFVTRDRYESINLESFRKSNESGSPFKSINEAVEDSEKTTKNLISNKLSETNKKRFCIFAVISEVVLDLPTSRVLSYVVVVKFNQIPNTVVTLSESISISKGVFLSEWLPRKRKLAISRAISSAYEEAFLTICEFSLNRTKFPAQTKNEGAPSEKAGEPSPKTQDTIPESEEDVQSKRKGD